MDMMRARLQASLPDYMVPAVFHWRATLPLTGNGKIDRKTLTALAGDLEAPRREPKEPGTATERWLVAKWADVLGIPPDRIGKRAHFFDLGGTSLSALRLAIALDRALSFKDIRDHPVLADQATLLGDRGVRATPITTTGEKGAL
jgi:hypothetical protein